MPPFSGSVNQLSKIPGWRLAVPAQVLHLLHLVRFVELSQLIDGNLQRCDGELREHKGEIDVGIVITSGFAEQIQGSQGDSAFAH